ncbi:M20/M25/M40 family metallo-hydrolase [Caulobacter sp. RHG1]|uniref:M20/M25/M40 family metallo-hydrolase n=1 Tax=Caulobacter sp. (strain RHG1) TaxID=2545762 RepID=UPI0015525B2C|nr:M20/M25/M40 family metallo-hydrolase [Caulobacter sp. RHG1]NQE61639.1 peptidase, M20/M25/M40 family [Caulobacter sp. RHG1]
MKNRMTSAALAALLCAVAAPALAQTPAKPAQVDFGNVKPPAPTSPFAKQAKALMAGKAFKTAKATLATGYDQTVADIVTLTEIPAPPFGETEKGKAFLAMLAKEGLTELETDAAGNVMGLRKGTGGGLLVVAAHLDTVFPASTDVKVRRDGDKLYAPGIGDDTVGLGSILAILRAINAAGIQTTSDILFVGDVGEEGPGDLRGMKELFFKGRYKDKIDAFISLEPSGPTVIVNGGVGSKRYKTTFKGPGGHSMGDFGTVNPAFALADAARQFGELKVPSDPRTVYNIGLLEGGTSVNSIPFAVAMTVDMRSSGAAELKAVEDAYLAILPKAVAAENAARSTKRGVISLDNKMVGDRPVGETAISSPFVQKLAAVGDALGKPMGYVAGSTDANIPMSLGKPAVTLGAGFVTFRGHSLEEGMEVNKDRDVESIATTMAQILMVAGAK